jgi:hypothetical protein
VVTLTEFLKGRDTVEALTETKWRNACELLSRINFLRAVYDKPLIVSSGYRPKKINDSVGGAKNSAHLSCEAIDIVDVSREFAAFCNENIPLLTRLGLYLEDTSATPSWVHLQTRKTKQNPFKP